MARQTRKKYQRRNWPAIIRHWEKSGLDPVEFCQKNQIPVNAFYSNRKQILHGNKKTNSFLEIPPSLLSGKDIQGGYEIILPGAVHIRTGNDFNPHILKDLIWAVKESWY